MTHRGNAIVVGAAAVCFASGQAAIAGAPVPELQDLVGAKGSSGEIALTNRGYTSAGVTGPTSPGYWREPGTARCVSVSTRNGRFGSIEYVPGSVCDRAAAYRPLPPPPSKTGFPTVCGAIVDGKTYRYRCTVEGAPVGPPGRTVLHFPDNRVDLEWLGGARVRVTFLRMLPHDTTFVTTEGTTHFVAWNKPYFFVSDRARAAAEVKAFRPE